MALAGEDVAVDLPKEFADMSPEYLWDILSGMEKTKRNLTLAAFLFILRNAERYTNDYKEERKSSDALKDMLATTVGVCGGKVVITKEQYLKDYKLSKTNAKDDTSVTLTAKPRR